MLKSTYKPSAASLAPLPPGWTEHKAPTGHTYFFNAETKESTYTRPGAVAPMDPLTSFAQHQAVPQINLSDPRVANAYMAQYNAPPAQSYRGGFGGGGRGRGGGHDRPRPQPIDKPRSKAAIPGCEPWLLVSTKYGRRFAYHPVKNASFWRIPEKLKAGILELDQQRIREKAGVDDSHRGSNGNKDAATPNAGQNPHKSEDGPGEPGDYDSSEYEEVEVTDDEAEGGGSGDDEHVSKRQRTEEPVEDEDQPVEFSEADIAYQLQAMGEDYGLEPGEYDDGNMDEWPEGVEGLGLSEEDSRALFKDLLNDFHINPYSPWEKLIEEGRVFDDPRYTVVNTMKARKEVWEEWSREKIKELKDSRAKEGKKDPRIPYFAFLQEKATPKLYWPEFKRKYKKESAMKDTSLSDKDREKWYREHISRLKLPQSTLKSDLTTLLKSISSSKLNNQTLPSHLPAEIVTDLRYISLDPKTRDPLLEAYIQTLGPPPEAGEADEDDEATKRAREDRKKREKALRDREHAVEEEKRRQEKKLRHSKAMLREEEQELTRAMQVDKRGLQSQLGNPKAM
ncbi:putative dna replication protein 4 protein [Phaeoacremonium minimum UCRPA7]|uniref:Putative dna replication protein 4 protein n=1 Tax=Phaeoacremonium minimum (strain UCR-PA7) TaxID=1286976 RepID=R8BCZ7_PHAM7|nr:putative dna replication protein 4 protein [Phaeoacremonium minimum UCRPA7]EON97184.1 putative dna replication protein 4 protein [Phaeoacremonium minimum UCRPA7]